MSRTPRTAGPGPEHYTDKTAAEKLGVSKRWLADRARAGGIPHVKFGRQRRYTDEHLARIAAMFTRDPADRRRAS